MDSGRIEDSDRIELNDKVGEWDISTYWAPERECYVTYRMKGDGEQPEEGLTAPDQLMARKNHWEVKGWAKADAEAASAVPEFELDERGMIEHLKDTFEDAVKIEYAGEGTDLTTGGKNKAFDVTFRDGSTRTAMLLMVKDDAGEWEMETYVDQF